MRQVGSISVALTEERKHETLPAGLARPRLRRRCARDLAGRGQGDVSAPQHVGRGRRRAPAARRPVRSGQHRHGAGQGRAPARRHDLRGRRRSPRCARRTAASTGVSWAKDGEEGTIETDIVVNCAGMWARELGAQHGVTIPLHACEHFYLVTEPIPGLSRLPVLRVPDECAYYKEDAGKMMLGAFEPMAKPWGMAGIPEDFCFDQLPEDFDHFEPILEMGVNRMPMLGNGRHPHLLQRPGELHARRPLLSRRGAGAARLLGGGRLQFDRHRLVGRRRHGAGAMDQRRRAALRPLGSRHPPRPAVPEEPPLSEGARHRDARPALRRPFPVPPDGDARAACAARRCTSISRRAARCSARSPAGSAPTGSRGDGQEREYRYSWKRQNWFDNQRDEHLAVRNGVGLFDMTSFGKIRVEGRDACAFLQRLCANDIDVPAGSIVYTQMLNERGGIESDLTVTRLSETAFFLVVPGATLQRDLAWLRRHLGDEFVVITDVTAAESVLCLMGPNARELIQRGEPERLLQRQQSVRDVPGDRDRLGPRARPPRHLCRRARLGALRLDRPGRACVRGDRGGRRRIRAEALRAAHAGFLPHREGVPPFRPRHHRRGPRAGGRPRLRGEDRRRAISSAATRC